MKKEALLINVSRGGVLDEVALIEALKQEWIAGAATDVFLTEPASKENSPLLKDDITQKVNLTVTPHLAWLSQLTIANLQRVLVDNLNGFLEGNPINVVKCKSNLEKN